MSAEKTKLIIIVAVLAITSLTYRLIDYNSFEQTSILFVGLPALLTILVIKYAKTPKTAYGVVFRIITLFLLMSSILLGEGIVCVLFAAPIFYGVSAIIVSIYEYQKKNRKINSILIIPVLILLSQLSEIKSTPPNQTIQVSKVFFHNINLQEDISKSPDLSTNLPYFFKLGFPKPVGIKVQGTDIGDEINISFKSTTKGVGVLSLRIVSCNKNQVVLEVAKDESHINHWLTWEKILIEVKQFGNHQSEVTWTTSYTCDLGPQWYFTPLENYAVRLMNLHLINTYFN